MAQKFKEEKIKFQRHLSKLFEKKAKQLPYSRREACRRMGISETYLSGIINQHMTRPKKDKDGEPLREPMPVLPNSYILTRMAKELKISPEELLPDVKERY